jgi:hypothetical protein
MKPRILSASVAAAVLALSAGSAEAAATIIEQTPQGYTLTVRLRTAGHGRLALTCPSGKGLGTVAFVSHRGRFTVTRTSGGRVIYKFAGKLDTPGHVKGSGSIAVGACGAGAASGFSEPAIGTARMTSCPASSVLAPLAAETPYPFAGVLPGAAQGTRLRIEYTNPDGSTAVTHLQTDKAGNFSDTHVFPSDGGTVYGADAIPRYPDDPLASGQGCDVEVQ